MEDLFALQEYERRENFWYVPTSNVGHTVEYLRTILAKEDTKITIESTKVGISQRGGPSAYYRPQETVQRTSVQSLLCRYTR